MSRRDKIKDLYAVRPETEKLAVANSRPSAVPSLGEERVLAGPVRSMGLALDRMEEESRALQQALASGSTVVEIDPLVVDGSFVRDRFDGQDDAFEEFKRLIGEHGQEVPILVRPHPDREGRFQVAYGHRRLRAITELGLKVRAVVKDLSDAELVVAQGLENSARRDLSYIEKAVFARRLEDRGFERAVIIDALSTDKGELSKLISVARGIPEEIIDAIGPAPKAGRRRWLALAERMEDPRARKAADKAAGDPDLSALDTDARFERVLAATKEKRVERPKATTWKSSGGHATAKIVRSGKLMTLAIDREPEFAEFVASQLDDLYSTFLSREKSAAQ
ncbi:plasmid partitioning protein RepB [Microvirga alba]|uniref:Plasmid partitioning protein RepB n=1 Tax=Microvirga alba TaxID=2791025 RepID=A0A931BQN2_9HYPH|nr:plasmid partitioning protein RepB [Microvirga alba]MBF9235696.1 plasmid partitioning protein RepB [Microvirga alba]